MKNKKGFTLAEVLVTLAVIGIVAALTIPSLIQSSNERQARTSIRKALSMLNQALSMSIAENGAGAASSSITNSLGLRDVFAPYMSTINDDDTNCAITTTDGMIYSFNRSDTCASVTDNDPASANCLVEVDINGESGNEAPGTTSSYSDLYYFIIEDQSVVPANADGTWNPAVNTFRDTLEGAGTGTVDNVAIDALLN